MRAFALVGTIGLEESLPLAAAGKGDGEEKPKPKTPVLDKQESIGEEAPAASSSPKGDSSSAERAPAKWELRWKKARASHKNEKRAAELDASQKTAPPGSRGSASSSSSSVSSFSGRSSAASSFASPAAPAWYQRLLQMHLIGTFIVFFMAYQCALRANLEPVISGDFVLETDSEAHKIMMASRGVDIPISAHPVLMPIAGSDASDSDTGDGSVFSTSSYEHQFSGYPFHNYLPGGSFLALMLCIRGGTALILSSFGPENVASKPPPNSSGRLSSCRSSSSPNPRRAVCCYARLYVLSPSLFAILSDFLLSLSERCS